MNFLSKYEIEIDYKTKKVWFSQAGGDEFTFGDGQVLNMMVSSVKGRKILSKGCMRYLAHICEQNWWDNLMFEKWSNDVWIIICFPR